MFLSLCSSPLFTRMIPLLTILCLATAGLAGVALAAEPCHGQHICSEVDIVAVAREPAANGAHMPADFAHWVSLDRRTWTYDAPEGARVQLLYPLGTWLGILDRQWLNGRLWLKSASGRWIDAEDVSDWQPSSLRGYFFKGHEQGQLGFILEDDADILAAPNRGAVRLGGLARYTTVGILGMDNGFYRIAPGQWVYPNTVRLAPSVRRPAGVGVEDKWIEVNLTAQTVAAYEGDRRIFVTLASTGKNPTPTVTGLFHVYEKKIGEFMAGGWEDKDPYILEEVPWTMYFTQRYALHGAYWHDNYGEVRSHGCVNLTPQDSKFLFTWSGPVVPPGQLRVLASPTNLGTWVYVHKP